MGEVGDQESWRTSSACDSKVWSLSLRFRISHRATVCPAASVSYGSDESDLKRRTLSAEPVMRMFSFAGEKARELTSAE